MKAEIIAVGTELLLGQIVNTNAQYISKQCAAIGVDVYFQTVVGDNPNRLRQAFEIAAARADVVICSGGLGPTQDDITKDVLANIMGKQLVMHEQSLEKIENYSKSRGMPMLESNARQALMIEGSTALINDTGMAVGTAILWNDIHFILLPGPPREMKPMFDDYTVPWLRSMMGDEVPLYSTMLKFAGIGESAVEDALLDLIKDQVDPTIAPYANEGEVTIRLSTKARTEEEGIQKLEPLKDEIFSRLGQYLYAEEEIPIEQALLARLKAHNATIATAESCTGGLLGERLTMLPGSSQAYAGGYVCYSNDMKHRLFQIPMSVLEGEDAPGSVSEEVAKMLCEQTLKQLQSDYAISITGVAGPDQVEGKPVGLVYIGLAKKDGKTEVFKQQFTGNRETIRWRAVKIAIYHLWNQIKP